MTEKSFDYLIEKILNHEFNNTTLIRQQKSKS